jgi:bacillithiol system protein YtxJ
MAHVTEIRDREAFDRLLEESHQRPVALLKHSIACPVSARGQEQFVGLEEDGDPPLYCLVVQYARDASNYVEEQTGVRHETPQALIFAGGAVAYHASHHRITTGSLRDAAREAASRVTPAT